MCFAHHFNHFITVQRAETGRHFYVVDEHAHGMVIASFYCLIQEKYLK